MNDSRLLYSYVSIQNDNLIYSWPQLPISSTDPTKQYFKHSPSSSCVIANTDTISAKNFYKTKYLYNLKRYYSVALIEKLSK